MRALLAPAFAAALLAAAGCGSHSQGPDASAHRLAALTSRGVQVDYTPLASPRDALAKGDLVVRGTLTDVVDGPSVNYPDPLYTQREAGGYATYVLTVDEVLGGDPAKLRDRRVYVSVEKSPSTRIADLAVANSRPSVVAVLDDISDWRPAPGATVTRPPAAPAGAPLFFAYTDGLWLQDAGAAEMTGVQAEPSDLPAAWNHPKTVAEVAAALRAAKG
jgi:hypothetical protein